MNQLCGKKDTTGTGRLSVEIDEEGIRVAPICPPPRQRMGFTFFCGMRLRFRIDRDVLFVAPVEAG